MKSMDGGELLHAYLIAGSAVMIPAVLDFARAGGVETRDNPDVYVREYRSFGIDDARELRERAQGRPVAGERRVFVVVTPSMTADAQNALLKTLEEPPAGAVFFFIVASPETLVPTLRSRAQILHLGVGVSSGAVEVGKFLAATPEKRIEMVKLLYQHEDERDVRGAVAFLAELERALAERARAKEVREGIRAVYLARKHLMDNGSLLKPLLEQVALLIPRM